MHDGSMATLWDVVEHYNDGGNKNTWQDPQIQKLELTDAQVDEVVAFLFTLTDKRFAEQNQLVYEQQRRRSRPVIR
jgi:cytochrome c peroxidase